MDGIMTGIDLAPHYHPAIYRGAEGLHAQDQQRRNVRGVEWNARR
jgi:hypothetical protein